MTYNVRSISLIKLLGGALVFTGMMIGVVLFA